MAILKLKENKIIPDPRHIPHYSPVEQANRNAFFYRQALGVWLRKIKYHLLCWGRNFGKNLPKNYFSSSNKGSRSAKFTLYLKTELNLSFQTQTFGAPTGLAQVTHGH